MNVSRVIAADCKQRLISHDVVKKSARVRFMVQI